MANSCLQMPTFEDDCKTKLQFDAQCHGDSKSFEYNDVNIMMPEHLNPTKAANQMRRDSVHDKINLDSFVSKNREGLENVVLKDLADTIEDLKTQLYLTKSNRNEPSELTPKDSSSVFERYEKPKRFWHDRYNEEVEDIGPSLESKQKSIDDVTILQGYKPTLANQCMSLMEKQAGMAVNGIQKVFVNDRLNFLAHIHTALYKITSQVDYPPSNFINILTKFCTRSPRSPQQALLKNVMNHTINFETFQVERNNFKLPVLRVGMHVSEQLIFLCFRQLQNEYEILYHDTTQGLSIPNFHSIYSEKSSEFYVPIRKLDKEENLTHREVDKYKSKSRRRRYQ